MLLKQGDRGFVISNTNKTEKLAVTFQSKKDACGINDDWDSFCTPRLLSIAAVSLSQRQKDNYICLSTDTISFKVSSNLFTFEGAGPVSTRRYHEPGERIIFACHFQEIFFAFREATIVTYDSKNKEYLVRKRYHDGEDTFIVPRYCVYIPNWKHLHTRCREAIWAWCLCARQVGLIKDVAQLIAREIWDLRDEREWE